MARTWLLGLGSALFVVGAAPACLPESFTFLPEGVTTTSGAGGSGGGGAMMCEPSSSAPCYTGPMGTKDNGVCKGGTAMCAADGSGLGACDGQVLPSFDDCVTQIDEDCDGVPIVCTGAYAWGLRWGDSAQQRGWGVALDADGNAVVVGEFQNTLGTTGLVSTGLYDVFVIKLDPSGVVLWAKRWGDAMSQFAYGVAVDQASGDVYVTGGFEGTVDFGTGLLTSQGGNDVFALKLNKEGDVLWSERFGDAQAQQGYDVAVGGGQVAIVGSFDGALNFGAGDTITSAGGEDGFVAVLDAATGVGIWDKGFGDLNMQSARRVRVGSGGSVIVAGYGAGMVDFGDGPRTSSGPYDGYLVKFGMQGAVIWSKLIGGTGDDRVHALALDAADNVIVGGSMDGVVNFGGGPTTPVGTTDMYVAKYDKTGALAWVNRFGNGITQPNGAAVDAAGNVALVGIVTGDIDLGGGTVLGGHGDADGFVMKLSANGGSLWGANFGAATGGERANEVSMGPIGEVILTGNFDGSIVFTGATPLTAVAGTDAFVVKVAP